jgi:chromosome segregation ATPase
MGLAANAKTYKSPDYKLLPFFHRSRDGWKAKAQDGKVRIKRLKNRVAALEESRRKWKEKARACEARIVALREEIEEQKNSPA